MQTKAIWWFMSQVANFVIEKHITNASQVSSCKNKANIALDVGEEPVFKKEWDQLLSRDQLNKKNFKKHFSRERN